MKKEKNEKGITLIALVITVIVLLILAGVTIAALSGDNGILTRTKEAKEKTEKENIIEQVNLAIMTATTEGTGTIDTSKLREELEKKEIKVETIESSLPWKVSAGNLVLKIDENLTIEEISGKMKISASAKQIASDPERYYGKVAENYTQGGLTYRIFYVDTENKFGDGVNTVYLKADYKTTIALTDHITYEPEGNDLAVYKKMNPSWAAERGKIAVASWNNNERAAGWLCSPGQWEDYVDSTKAKYAIGAPSLEMFVESYNQVSHTEQTNYKLGAIYRNETPGYIYTLNGEQSSISNSGTWTGDNTIDYQKYNSMYAGKDGTKVGYCWLASASSHGTDYMNTINGNYGDLDSHIYSNANSISIVISLKTGITVEIEE